MWFILHKSYVKIPIKPKKIIFKDEGHFPDVVNGRNDSS